MMRLIRYCAIYNEWICTQDISFAIKSKIAYDREKEFSKEDPDESRE